MGASKKFVLVIDAGHGGKDAGAIGSFSQEKTINLKTALAFGRYVEQNCPDVKVVYTRKTDIFKELYERADIANKNHADVFISIHTNALPNGHIGRGVETYSMTLRRSEEKLSAAKRENSVITFEKDYEQHYAGYDSNSDESNIMFEYIHDENMAKSVELSKCIQKNLCSSANRPDKGVKQDNFHVLRRTSMPACLVELGFISTPDEEQLLNNAEALDRMAFGIYKGFLQYKNQNSDNDDLVSYSPETPPVSALIGLPVAPSTATDTPKATKRSGNKTPSETKLKETNITKEKTKGKETNKAEEKAKGKETVKTKETSKAKETPKTDKSKAITSKNEAPVFKVQFATGPKMLKEGDTAFKGLKGVGCYKEGKNYKFTVGEFVNFSDAAAKKKEIADKFPDAFIVAFRNGERMDLTEARNYKKK